MFFAFEGLYDEAEQHPVGRVLERSDRDVVEAKARKCVEPVLQSPVGEVDGCPMVVFGAGVLDARVEVVVGGVEGV
ncbi:hypothetical protein [Nonomuraea jabiensis]|uniref:Uncharacterized protein n=1 Tax=Nonomuraea jabiensis TaxID=882448 RepID=A0A7W9GGN8_9ACTN|nr:hypothetical protein [Nonomuraea jabiensis]MBB5783465.1 hypothetical protein [Nonomuraea jabiensis]